MAGDPGSAARALSGVVQAHGPAAAVAWLQRALPSMQAPFARGLFFGFYAGAGRRFGHAPPELSAAERAGLNAVGIAAPQVFSLSDLARAALLLSACAVAPEAEHVALAQEAFRKGDNAERVALLRVLALLPEPARFVDLAAEASRTHVQDVFEALAADNPFPARYLPELNWNQLVMKALFTGVSLERVLDWRSRLNPELLRMAADYEAERRAAGRAVPQDVELMRAAAAR